VLLFVNQHYYPDVASTGQHLTDLAEYLARRGVPVEVLTSRGHYVAGRVDAPAREVRNGVRIRRVRTTAFGRRSRPGRVIDYATFYVRVLWVVLVRGDLTGVVFLTTPPLLGVIGRLGRMARGRRYGIWSMDLHPDAEIAAGMVGARSPLGRLLIGLNAAAYRGADFVIDLGAYMKARIIQTGLPAERTHTIAVWGHEPAHEEGVSWNVLRKELGLDDRFIVMYSGNAGIVHDFDDICEAMRLLRDNPRIYFLFAGDGPRRPEIEAYAARHGLTNFSYRPYFPREELDASLKVADAHLVSLRQAFVGISVPGKLYGIMAAERPALFVGPARCETADTIRDAGCGEVIDPAEFGAETGRRIAATLDRWSADPIDVRAKGKQGLYAFQSQFGRDGNCAEFERVIRASWPLPPVPAARSVAVAVPGEEEGE
jgi:colanic acid biosynthesis glycosyl transferase WcaI